MKTTVNFLDEIKNKHGITSDYALSTTLGMTRSMISRYRMKKDYLSDELAIKAADLLDLEPAYVVACVHAERAKPTEEKKLWERIAAMFETKKYAGIAALLVVAIVPLATASLPSQGADNGAMYIM